MKENVIWLNLTGCVLKDDHLSYLSAFPNLIRLKIQKNPFITDKGIEALQGLENLSQLNLFGTRVTDAAFISLSRIESLEKIFLWNTLVTPKGVKAFKALHPNIEVISGLLELKF